MKDKLTELLKDSAGIPKLAERCSFVPLRSVTVPEKQKPGRVPFGLHVGLRPSHSLVTGLNTNSDRGYPQEPIRHP